MSQQPGGDGRGGGSVVLPVCGNCLFSAVVAADTLICRRNPPTPDPSQHVLSSGDRRPGVWPTVDPGDWCGEHKPK